MNARALAAAAILAGLAAAAGGQVASDLAVEVSASVQKSPPKITLSWPAKTGVSSYTVYRKAPSAATWGNSIATLPGSATGYADTAVAVGTVYEYRVSGSGDEGYLYSGIEVPLTETRGKVVLVVDATNAAALSAELARLRQDLVGDGWTVIRRDVARAGKVVDVKAVIAREYARDPANVRAVLLFGHVPVPYAGAVAPDGHPNHYGAWPADVYYGDMDGLWTDVQNFDSTVAGRQHNVAGDGKFDQSSIPSSLELEVGRVDLANMPSFAPKTELDLLRQYLDKDHNFRHTVISAQRRGLIDDNFGYFGGEAFASTGWRSFSSFFGAANVFALDWFSTLATQSYLWGYGCGGGSFTGAGGVGSTSNFAATDTQVVFTMLFGSYFGDWDSTDNFLRAPLATATHGLSDAWAGRPAWFFHPMGLGETLGYAARLSQNNMGLYWNSWGGPVHVALMGDPTLRMHPVAPPSSLVAMPAGGGANLSWTASPDTIVGYDVYRATSPAGPFTRINGSPVAGTTFSDTSVAGAAAGTYTWMVRAVKLEASASGTYFNASQGIFADAVAGTGPTAADLSILLYSSADMAVPTAPVTFNVFARNDGPADASSVQWTQTIPAGLTFASVSPPSGCSFSAPTLTCAVGVLARDQEAAWTVSTAAASAGTLASTATISGSPADPNASNNLASASVTVVSSAATATLLASSLNPATVGQSITLTATVTSTAAGSPTGTVAFREGSTTLGTGTLNGSGQATWTSSALPGGVHAITASYAGDSHFAASVSAAVSQQVRASTTTTLASSANPALAGQAVTLTATVASAGGHPTGNVSFTDGGTAIGYGTLDGSGAASYTTWSLAVGSHSIQASYGGDGGFNPSTSSTLTQTIQAATGAATTATLVSSPNPSVVGQSVTFTAAVSSTTAGTIAGTVTFVDGTRDLGTAALDGAAHASLATTALPAGNHSIRSIYNGSAAFNPSASAFLQQMVKDTTTTVLSSSPNPSAPGQSVTLTATITAASPTSYVLGGTATFFDGAATLGTASVTYPGRATLTTSALSTGSHTLTVTFSGDSGTAGSTSAPHVHVVTGPTSFYTLAPCRVLDTRSPIGPYGGPAIAGGSSRTFVFAGRCGIPSSAKAVSVNVAVTRPAAAGFVTLFAAGAAMPHTSNVNFRAGQTRANGGIVYLGSAGDLTIWSGLPSGTADVLVDVNGYFQ